MKLIAHRGASLERPENTLESLTHAAQLGADAVECDVRETADGGLVIFHDDNLQRLCGLDWKVRELTESQLREALEGKGRSLLTLDGLLRDYGERVPVLLHIKGNQPLPSLVERLRETERPFIAGVQSLEMLREFREFLPPERILAFMPRLEDLAAFIQGGAGILRLWEGWLEDCTPAMAKALGAPQVWIMSRHEGSMDGNEDSLRRFHALGADGALLNDIVLGLKWRSRLS